MATLNLDKVWVNLLSTGQAVAAVSKRGRGEKYDKSGETRTYAGGRRRSIVVAGEIGVFTFGMVMLSRANVELLRAWVGLPVEVRDTYGRRFFGVYYSVQIGEYVESAALWDVDITLSAVTAQEGV